MTSDRDITAMLERAVADVVPAERRPTDAVLVRAAARPTARLRKYLAGLVGVAVIGGGAVVVATGSDDNGRVVDTPKPLRLTVEPPAGWSVVDRPVAVDCATELAPRTVYRDATIGDLSHCGDAGPTVTGPVLLVGRLDAQAAEQIRSVGTPVTAAGLPGFATGYDNIVSTITWVPAGDHGDLGYVALAPKGADDTRAFPDPLGLGTPTASREVLDVAGTVGAKGDAARRPVLPVRVSAVRLLVEWVNVDPAPGAQVLDATAVGEVLDALEPAAGEPECGRPVGMRTLYLQDAASGRWSRTDVLEDAAGCRTAVSELGGSARITGDPVAVAYEGATPPAAPVRAGAEVVRAHGLAVSVPVGWDVVRAPSLDPCTLAGPSVVVADEFAPTCYLARPNHPYLWLTSRPLEDDRFVSDYGLTPRPTSREVVDTSGLAVTWTGDSLELADHSVDGLLGVPADGSGRLFVVGLDPEQSAELRASVGGA